MPITSNLKKKKSYCHIRTYYRRETLNVNNVNSLSKPMIGSLEYGESQLSFSCVLAQTSAVLHIRMLKCALAE